MRFAVVLALLTLAGCTCTESGCFDGLWVDLEKQTAWADGEWTVTAYTDELDPTCSFHMPAAAAGTDSQYGCSGNAEILMFGDADHPQAAFLLYGRHPDDVEVEVLLDGAEVASDRFQPTYSEYWPNGRRCGSSCNSGSEQLAVP